MDHTLRKGRHLAMLAIILLSWASLALGLPVEYCTTVNTATTDPDLDIYQSHGLCSGTCSGKGFAFAIVQYQSCWCSNYAPASTVSGSRCDTGCPGFGEEKCGGDGLFGYIALGKNPSGTRGSTSPTSTPKPDQATVTFVTTRSRSTGRSTSTTSSSSSATTNTQPTAVQTVTADGTVRTVFVTPSSGSQSADMYANSSTPSTGAIVGIVIGVIAFVVLAAAAIFCFYLARRKRRQREAADDLPSPHGSSSLNTATPRLDMSEAGDAGWGAGAGPGAAAGAGAAGALGRRGSKLIPMDPRMDPFHVGIYARSKSHESINTLRDDHDYSRKVHQPKVLRATNPDPHPDD